MEFWQYGISKTTSKPLSNAPELVRYLFFHRRLSIKVPTFDTSNTDEFPSNRVWISRWFSQSDWGLKSITVIAKYAHRMLTGIFKTVLSYRIRGGYIGLTVTRGTRYSSQAYCSHCEKWESQSALVTDSRGNLRCDQCGKRVRLKPRRHVEQPTKGKLDTFMEHMREFFADYWPWLLSLLDNKKRRKIVRDQSVGSFPILFCTSP
jgi:hypothetical protein